MMDREDIKLNVVSSISDEYIDEVTLARIEAKRSVAKRKKIFTSIISAAAAVFILLGALLPILLIENKQVPIYMGMTVSNESPLITAEEEQAVDALPLSYYNKSEAPIPDRKTKPIKESVKDYFNATPGKAPYYAKPNEDIYITIKFDNPDDFVILSFTLNGKTYSSYMFEEGSDMENIVLKVNVGDAEGLVSYTIDAIKYVDGEKIKDVKIGADRTVSVGIYNENQPTASLSSINITSAGVSFDASVTDAEALIAVAEGKIYAIISDGESIVAQKELTLGNSTGISFTDLTPLKEYTAAIVAVFDAYDGEGTAPHVLCEHSFITNVTIIPKNIAVVDNSVTFELDYANDLVMISKIEIVDILGNVVAKSDEAVTSFDGIPGGKMKIRITYTYDENGTSVQDTSEAEFVCTKGMMPLIGKISAHYDPNVVFYGDSYRSGHFGTDIIPTTDNLEIYSITDGVITMLTKDFSNASTFVCGRIEILDDSGIYHSYNYLKTADLAVGDRVKAGDVLGTLGGPRDIDMTIEESLHYACYTKNGDAKIHIPPSFDPEPREVPEGIRIEKIALSEYMLVSGELNVEGAIGETVSYATNFEFTYDDERVELFIVGDTTNVRLEKTADGQYEIICDFDGITEPLAVRLRYFIYVANNRVKYVEFITLTLIPTEASK